MEVSGQLHALATLPPRKRAPGTHCIGGHVVTGACLDAVVKEKKFSALAGSRTPDHPARSPALYHWAIRLPGPSLSFLYSRWTRVSRKFHLFPPLPNSALLQSNPSISSIIFFILSVQVYRPFYFPRSCLFTPLNVYVYKLCFGP
jgi:hypothetical protein